MATKPLSMELMKEAVDAVHAHGSIRAASVFLKLPYSTLEARLAAGKRAGLVAKSKGPDDPQTLKRAVADLKSELKAATQQSADNAAIKAVIRELGAKANTEEVARWITAPIRKASSPGVPTLFLSDFHWGENVRPSQIGGVNKFNIPIARERLHYCVETAIHLLRILDKGMDYPGIVVPLGGDMISGNIHDELTATNDLPTMPTVLDLYSELIAAINRLADVFGKVFLPCVTGNHGRDTMKIWKKDRHHTSFDWLMYQFLARHFADDKRIRFYIPDGSDALFKIYNTRYLLTHGDQFRGGDGIIGAIGPLMRGNQKKQARNQAINQEYDLMICGHWHQYIHLTRMIVNGTLKGMDEYAYQSNFSFEEPSQALWMTHPKYGITYRMPVYVQKKQTPKRAEWVSIQR